MSHVGLSPASPASHIPRKPLPPSYRPIVQVASQHSESLQSEQSQSKNVKQKGKNSEAGAKWVVGWKTPVAMVSCYVLALLISITHLSMFIFLDDEPIASYHQSYVTTASTILASIFGLSLKGALGIAFTQSLWSILRKSAQKIRFVEDLFTMRGYPYMALRRGVLRNAPLLSVFTIILWSLEIVTNFPPGALTVTSKSYDATNLVTVMALNTSYLGTGNVSSLLDTSIAVLAQIQNTSMNLTNTIPGIQEQLSGASDDNQTLIRRESVLQLASDTMITGAITTHPSPCGLNCTYSLRLVGPYVMCDTQGIEAGYMIPFGTSLTYYFGVWSNPQDDVVVPYINPVAWGRRAESTSVATFNTSIYAPVGAEPDGGDIFVEEHSLQCRPGQAIYNINVTYQDGEQTFDIQTEPESIRVLMDLTKPNYFSNCSTGCECCDSLDCSCRPLSDINLQWLSDANNMAIIESMTLALAGQYNVELDFLGDTEFNYTDPDGSNITLWLVTTSDDNYNPVHLVDQGATIASSGPQNGTIIARENPLFQRLKENSSSFQDGGKIWQNLTYNDATYATK